MDSIDYTLLLDDSLLRQVVSRVFKYQDPQSCPRADQPVKSHFMWIGL
jgi:hypothetical protein